MTVDTRALVEKHAGDLEGAASQRQGHWERLEIPRSLESSRTAFSREQFPNQLCLRTALRESKSQEHVDDGLAAIVSCVRRVVEYVPHVVLTARSQDLSE